MACNSGARTCFLFNKKCAGLYKTLVYIVIVSYEHEHATRVSYRSSTTMCSKLETAHNISRA